MSYLREVVTHFFSMSKESSTEKAPHRWELVVALKALARQRSGTDGVWQCRPVPPSEHPTQGNPPLPKQPQPCPTLISQPTNHTIIQDRTEAQTTGHLGEKPGDHQPHVLPPLRSVGVKGVQVPGELQRHHLELSWKRQGGACEVWGVAGTLDKVAMPDGPDSLTSIPTDQVLCLEDKSPPFAQPSVSDMY